MSHQTSPLDRHRENIERWAITGWSFTEIANELRALYKLDTTRHSVRRALHRWGVELPSHLEARAGFETDGEEAEITSNPQPARGPIPDTDTLLRERGLDPEEWNVENVIVNEWDALDAMGDTITLRQLKVHCKRVTPLNIVLPADIPVGYQPKPKFWDIDKPSQLVVFVGDQQAPFHNERLHQLFCNWLHQNEPEKGVLIGDTMDFPDISRHPANPEWAATTQGCINAAYLLLRDYVQSSEGTNWTKLAGNHDERLRRAVIDRLTDLYGLVPAHDPDTEHPELSIFDIRRLLRLDELRVDYVQPNGGYNYAQHRVSPHLAARHGWIARKGSGASALATLEHLGFSVVVGHTHKQGQVHKTRQDIDGTTHTITAVETGCMCRIEDGLGYAVSPDWQNGFATAEVWPDGMFKLDLGTYVENVLLWRNQRYE